MKKREYDFGNDSPFDEHVIVHVFRNQMGLPGGPTKEEVRLSDKVRRARKRNNKLFYEQTKLEEQKREKEEN